MNIAMQNKSRPQAEAKLNDRGHRRHLARVTTSRAEKSQMGKHAHAGIDDRGKSPACCSSSRCPFFYNAPSSMLVLASASCGGFSSDRPLIFRRHNDKSMTFPFCQGWHNAHSCGVGYDVENGIALVGK